MFPSSLLAKLFVHGSLKNTTDGFEFQLKNIIDSGTLVGLGPVMVDDSSYTPDLVTVKIGDKEINGAEVSRTSPLPVRASSEIHLHVTGEPLQEGVHKVTIQIFTREVGKLQFSVNEPVAI